MNKSAPLKLIGMWALLIMLILCAYQSCSIAFYHGMLGVPNNGKTWQQPAFLFNAFLAQSAIFLFLAVWVAIRLKRSHNP